MVGRCAAHDDGRMTTPDPTTTLTPPPNQRDGLTRFFDSLRGIGIWRRADDRWIGGVSSGLAVRLGVDPLLVRAAFVGLAILGGIGVTAYLIAWAFLPDTEGRIKAESALRHGDGGSIVLLVFVFLSVFPFDDQLWWRTPLTIGVVIAAIALIRSGNNASPAVTPPTPPAPGVAQPTYRPAYAVPTPPPPRPKRPGGFPATLVVAGLAVLAYVAGSQVARALDWSQASPRFFGLLWALIALAGSGVLLGLRGWRAPLYWLMTVLVAISATMAGVLPGLELRGGVGDQVWRPTSSVAETYRLALGDATFDLRDIQPSAVAGERTTLSLGAGSLRILVPSGITATVTTKVGLGDYTVTSAEGGRTVSTDGAGLSETATVGSGTNHLNITVEVGLGDVTIEELP